MRPGLLLANPDVAEAHFVTVVLQGEVAALHPGEFLHVAEFASGYPLAPVLRTYLVLRN